MDQPAVLLSFNYHFTKAQALRFNYHYFYPYRFRRRRQFITIAAPLLMLLALLLGIALIRAYYALPATDQSQLLNFLHQERFTLILTILMGGVGALTLYQSTVGLKNRIRAQHDDPDYAALFSPAEITFTERGIHHQNAHFRYTFAWEEIKEVVDFDQFLAIFVNQSNGLILEKASLTERQLTDLYAVLESHSPCPITTPPHRAKRAEKYRHCWLKFTSLTY